MTQIVDRPLLDETGLVSAPAVLFSGEETVTAGRILSTSMTDTADTAWADTVVAELGAGERAVVSLDFAPGGAAIAHRVAPLPYGAERVGRWADDLTVRAAVPSAHQVTELPSVHEYESRVRTAVERIRKTDLEKVVLGRCVEILSQPPLEAAAVLARLLATRPGRYVFGLPLTASTQSPVLLGGSPELLVRRHGSAVTSFPLAGSAPRSSDTREDRRQADALQTSAKDLAEHAYVVDAILDALEPWCVELQAAPRPVLVTTDTLHHLGTPITARLDPSRGLGAPSSALHLAQLLQPTPAVGGVPVAGALSLIDELEGDRGPLAGAVGWVDADGDGEFAVTIRAGVLDGERLRLFAGAGIVADSDPASEGRETGAKLATMLRAVGVQ
ncbi:isochorismate synthase MenF [Nocardioides sp. Kera G14]|uniref:isochorismate synthase n=1 Tax=Nocardioides sp. Kera G14 TaxID=2884264 RepID=UPI001D12E9FB|nr:isochorismate synthase [Nocardioides sp. Kera G14]UDY24264.1 isochorismate synthase [Nocardioides sp. Kera G14]